jgi:antitoxin (DNA-binding transcriptional repressor) of toxin-antitoxin stability system
MQSVNIRQLKNNPSEAVRRTHDGPVLILKGDHPEAILMHLDASAATAEGDGLALALAEKWLRPLDLTPTEPAYPHLGDGETSCLRVALARAEPTLLLLDDRLARREARRAGLQIIGVAAIIGMAEQRQLIPSARVVFDALLQTDFRIGVEVIQSVLDSLVATRGAAR